MKSITILLVRIDPLPESVDTGSGVNHGQEEHPPLLLLPRGDEPEGFCGKGGHEAPRIFLGNEEKPESSDDADVPLRKDFKGHYTSRTTKCHVRGILSKETFPLFSNSRLEYTPGPARAMCKP